MSAAGPAPFALSWSGGKDSALALLRAREAGGRPLALLNMLDETGTRSRSHGLRPEVLAAQAAALGLPLWTARASWASYGREFTALLTRAAGAGAQAAVFGDIDLQDHRDWEERVCAAAGLEAVLPLWNEPRRALVEEGLRRGLRARIVAVREDALPAGLLGRLLDPALLDEIERLGADACGERGEYHTVVVDGPGFAAPLRLCAGAVHRAGGVATLDLRLEEPGGDDETPPMRRVLVTGMSGTGKSSVLGELARRGHRTVDTDTDEWCEWTTDREGQPDWVWREAPMRALLSSETRLLFVGGCKSNQGDFYSGFDRVVLLSAPAEVLLARLRTRTNNPYGKTPEQQAEVLEYLETVQPLLRAGADLELDSGHLSVAELADALEALATAPA